MKTFAKVALTGGVVTVVGGGGYGIYEMTSSKTTNKELFADTLLEDDNRFSETWTARFEALAKAKSSEIDELKNLADLDALKGWCKAAKERSYVSKKDSIFIAIEKYCTKTIKDTLLPIVEKSGIPNNTNAWKRRHNKLKLMNENDLVQELLDIKKASNKSGADVKGWCDKAYKDTYKGMDEKLLKNAQALCDRREAIENFMADDGKELLPEGEWQAKVGEYEKQATDPLNIKGASDKKKQLEAVCKVRKNIVVDKEEQLYKDFDSWCTKTKSLGK